jgi:hypothetical protein
LRHCSSHHWQRPHRKIAKRLSPRIEKWVSGKYCSVLFSVVTTLSSSLVIYLCWEKSDSVSPQYELIATKDEL